MSTSALVGEEPAVFAHHVRAVRARQRREDDEAIGGFLKRAGFRAQADDRASRRPQGRSANAGPERIVDFHAASPLTRRDRQTGGFRVPHFDVKAVVAIHPPARNGVVHPRCGSGGMSAAAHFDYVTDGARIGLATHIDYIRRQTGIDDSAGDLLIDMLDEQEIRGEKNRLACYTNIAGGWTRARSLFEAAERVAPPPKSHLLQASTLQVTSFEIQLKLGGAFDWFREMTRRLQVEAAEVEREAIERGRPARHRTVTIAEVSSEEAYQRLDWFDRRRPLSGLISWKQGRTQRSQHRFVGELPDGLSAIDRHRILSRFCGTLADDGWMVVGAIHQPDRHNDSRNFHIHVDGYDRPAKWLDEHECWDFEFVERRNGKDTHPYRQNKVRYDVPLAGLLRERFITIVNEVIGDRSDIVRYLHGTYADNGIDLTPLEHMGNRAIGLEARGIETEVGSRNARRIFADEAAACEKRATDPEAALASELELIRAIIRGDREALMAVERYERLEQRLIRRRLQRELADIVIAKARSRADTVVHTLTPTPGRPVTPRDGDAELLAEALAHLAWIDRHSPTLREREAARKVEEALAAKAAKEMRIIEAATARYGSPEHKDAIVYLPQKATDGATASAPRFDDQKRDRLGAWLRKHAADQDMLILDGGTARLARTVPKSIDTLMRRFAGEPRFQRLLSAERSRRVDREMLSRFGFAKTIRSASPGSKNPGSIRPTTPSRAPHVTLIRTLPILESSKKVPAPRGATPAAPTVAPVGSAADALLTQPAARHADRGSDASDAVSRQMPEKVTPKHPDHTILQTQGAAAPDQSSSTPAPAEKPKVGLFAQASAMPSPGARTTGSKGPASPSAPISPRDKGWER